jgi:hypothetical protein
MTDVSSALDAVTVSAYYCRDARGPFATGCAQDGEGRQSNTERPLTINRCSQAMARIGAKEKVTLFVPVSIAQYSMYEALAAELLPSNCHSCTLPAAEVTIVRCGLRNYPDPRCTFTSFKALKPLGV